MYTHLKDTSPTSKLRESSNVNKRTQDGIKLYWLCKTCETRFSNWEKYFSETIYHPLQKNELPIHYNEQFLKFCVSITWRVLKYIMEEGMTSNFSAEITTKLNNALEAWKKFLFDQDANPSIYEQHFYNFTGTIEKTTLPISPNIHRYLQRSIAIDVIHWGPHAIIVYAKFPGLLLVGFVNIENRGDFRDTKVHVKNGSLNHQNFSFSDLLWSYIQAKSESTRHAKQSISQKQKEKIKDDYSKLPSDKIIASGTFQSLQKDIELSTAKDAFQKNSNADSSTEEKKK